MSEKHLGPLEHADNLIRCATLAWTTDIPFNLFESDFGIFYDDKEGWYAGRIIVELINALICHTKCQFSVSIKLPHDLMNTDAAEIRLLALNDLIESQCVHLECICVRC